MNRYFRKLRIQFLRRARRNRFWSVISSVSRERYAERISGSIIYGILSSIAVNFFFQSGNVYSSGVTGIAQIISAISVTYWGVKIPLALVYYGLNLPLLIIAWYKIGNKFTIFTFITVTFSSFFIQFMPHITLTTDPIVNAIFGGLMLGTGIGFALRNNVSSGGTDIVSILIRKKTGRQVGSTSFIINVLIMFVAGITFGWKYALYSMISLFVCSQMTDVIYVKQKRMQAMIITSHPNRVIKMIQKKLHRGVTIINGAEGAYNHEQKTVLITIITRAEFNDFKSIMKKTDKTAFVSVADNVNIIGRFVEADE
ncbi:MULTISPECIES: YitT family protein [unclassified Streptococcus]|uniref:YitT family protein n=1 Tax=unclassified Streptococcus TaxID=2608887 RepID=UPI0010729061|nr:MULTISPECIES: YitT family protein [unclassified Streptococcus]MBF0787529.1 YitT family protein [Streptococcus sp. 19428wC2_LYSM12]MCQ9211446.1 YitT family protein [Streptococcus sp. B01]MCQ9214761.1 YitT family protein [Streptococcus sp. O1]TFV05480.1 YitT family protein [Streptococcus sp. LYSM12]